MFEDLTPSPAADAPESPDDWKAALRQDIERWLQAAEEIPVPDDQDLREAETPDLYSFFEQLAVLGTEARRGNRRTAETLSQWGEVLTRFDQELVRLRELVSQNLTASAGEGGLPRAQCLLLIEWLDRLHRVGVAFGSTPGRTWWGGDDAWRKSWETQRQAVGIVTGHLEALLKKQGLTRLATVGQPFDPSVMVAVATEADPQRPAQTVLEEMAAGWLRNGELLRTAQVKISVQKGIS